MKTEGLHQIRKEFLEFFEEKNHIVLESFPLVPQSDKSLLLVNAGMAPLKPYFTGEKTPPSTRVATCQKCIRTGDIENVGMTARHATFFEMLGNFSFGDYFKREAIAWSWEFLHERLEIPKEDFWVSVYYEDEEAKEIWRDEIGIDEDRIVPLGKEDNFWELEVGPCGPSSEIYVDRGIEFGCGDPNCKPGCDCDRFLEVWNLVFTQFDKTEDGEYLPIEHPNIDTGMGLERIAAVLQNTDNIFEVKEIKELLDFVAELTSTDYGKNARDDISIRVITDHVRAMTFLVSDGVLPSNEGRGYVLRRLIRRAARHGKLLGMEDVFLTSIVDEFIDSWSIQYKDLASRREQIKKVIRAEESKFQETIHQGINILDDYIEEMRLNKKDILDGEKAFKLYDTYGFPVELTKEILLEKSLNLDESGFNENMEAQRNRARQARDNHGNIGWSSNDKLVKIDLDTEFEGYSLNQTSSKVIGIIKDNIELENLSDGEKALVVLDQTAFYGESGGQVGDTGYFENDKVFVEVLDTQKTKDGKILHLVYVKEGSLELGDQVTAKIDLSRRKDIMKNHSATHLLHKALKEVLGQHVNQAGSLVLADRLRFDFTHYEAPSEKELEEIERLVNDFIFAAYDVSTEEMSLEKSKEEGVVGLFEGKYGDLVRVVKMGDVSMELCGGTHVSNTSSIGIFKIVSEGSVASGVRRIEAITGKAVYNHLRDLETSVVNIADLLKTNKDNLESRLNELLEETREKDKEIKSMKSKMASSISDEVLSLKKEILGIPYIVYSTDEMDIDGLRDLGDELKVKLGSYVIVLASTKDDKLSFVSMVSKDLNKRGINAGNIIREVAKKTGGGGGGRPDMAQAGGRDKTKLKEALALVETLISNNLK